MENADRKVMCAGKLLELLYIHPFVGDIRSSSASEMKIWQTRCLSDLSAVLDFNKNCIVTMEEG